MQCAIKCALNNSLLVYYMYPNLCCTVSYKRCTSSEPRNGWKREIQTYIFMSEFWILEDFFKIRSEKQVIGGNSRQRRPANETFLTDLRSQKKARGQVSRMFWQNALSIPMFSRPNNGPRDYWLMKQKCFEHSRPVLSGTEANKETFRTVREHFSHFSGHRTLVLCLHFYIYS